MYYRYLYNTLIYALVLPYMVSFSHASGSADGTAGKNKSVHGRGQTLNLNKAREEHFPNVSHSTIFSFIFPQYVLIFFLTLVFRVGTRKSSYYATESVSFVQPGK